MSNACCRNATTAAVLASITLAGAVLAYAAEGVQNRSRKNEQGDTLKLLSVSPTLPAVLEVGEKISVKFSYTFVSGDECLIWVRPLKDGQRIRGYVAHGSPRYSRGSGEAEGWFTMREPANIDRIRIRMVDAASRSEDAVALQVPADARWTAADDHAEDSSALQRADLRQLAASGWKASWSPDGRRVVCGKPAGTGLQILDLETGQASDLVDTGKDAAWSPDGRLIAYVREPEYNQYLREEVWIVTPSGQHDRQLAEGGFPGWSSDSRRVYFHSRRENKMYAVEVGTPNAAPTVFFERPLSWYPAVSPDGRRIAFGTRGALVIVQRETGDELFRLATPGVRGLLPAWSPDGRHVAFGSFRTSLGLWVVDTQDQQARRVVAGHYTMPAWSADGTKLAFDLRVPEGNQLWMVTTEKLRDIEPSVPAAEAVAPRARESARRSSPKTGFPIGTVAPEIEGHDIEGTPMKLSDFRGQVVVLDFWGDW